MQLLQFSIGNIATHADVTLGGAEAGMNVSVHLALRDMRGAACVPKAETTRHSKQSAALHREDQELGFGYVQGHEAESSAGLVQRRTSNSPK